MIISSQPIFGPCDPIWTLYTTDTQLTACRPNLTRDRVPGGLTTISLFTMKIKWVTLFFFVLLYFFCLYRSCARVHNNSRQIEAPVTLVFRTTLLQDQHVLFHRHHDSDEGHEPEHVGYAIKSFQILKVCLKFWPPLAYFPSPCTLEVGEVVPETLTLSPDCPQILETPLRTPDLLRLAFCHFAKVAPGKASWASLLSPKALIGN